MRIEMIGLFTEATILRDPEHFPLELDLPADDGLLEGVLPGEPRYVILAAFLAGQDMMDVWLTPSTRNLDWWSIHEAPC